MSGVVEKILSLIEAGGGVLWILLLIGAALWAFLFERAWYVFWQYPRDAARLSALWHARREHRSWNAHQIRQSFLGISRERLQRNIILIRALIAISPLCGLLGTVSGMIALFDVLTLAGTGDPRAMASGVSQATIPTMAGMVVAVSGMIAASRLESAIRKRQAALVEDFGFE